MTPVPWDLLGLKLLRPEFLLDFASTLCEKVLVVLNTKMGIHAWHERTSHPFPVHCDLSYSAIELQNRTISCHLISKRLNSGTIHYEKRSSNVNSTGKDLLLVNHIWWEAKMTIMYWLQRTSRGIREMQRGI